MQKPAAVLASNDVPGRQLAEMCRQLTLRVPDDVALLGVDNDELECLLCHPPLSSVVNPAEQIGYEAAKLLDRLMAGRRPPRKPVLVEPLRIVTRQSTDIVAIADADVSKAVAYMRGHVAENIGPAQVVDSLATARRGLERRFRKLLGRTILEEIQRVCIERARHLLAETGLPLAVIARRCGFSSSQRMATVFRQTTGQSPLDYRRSGQLGP